MSRNVAPMLWPAVALLLGIYLAGVLVPVRLSLWVGLLAAGLCWGRDFGRLLAFLACGFLWGVITQHELNEGESRLHPERSVNLVVRVSDHPREEEDGWVLRTRILRVQQKDQIFLWPVEVWLSVPPSEDPPIGIGTVLRVRGHLKRSSGYANRVPIRTGPWRLRVKSWQLLVVEEQPGQGHRLIARVRQGAERLLAPQRLVASQAVSQPGLMMARSLILGQKYGLPLSWQRGLRRSGLGHLTAVSGLHVGLIFVLIWGLSWWLRRSFRLVVALLSVLAYLLLVGPHPSMIRATVMAVLCTLAVLSERPPALLQALACCVAWMVLADPTMIGRLGFQLSVSATAMILLLAPRLEAAWNRLPRWLCRSMSVSLAAQLGTMPFTLPLMGGWHPLSVFLNLVAVPWLAVALSCCFGTLFLSALWPPMTTILLPVLNILASPLHLISALPASNLWFLPWRTALGGCGLLALFLLAVSSLEMERLRFPAIGSRLRMPGLRWLWILPIILLVSWLGFAKNRGFEGESRAEIVLFDVGQGDALLLREGNRTLLVDGGGWHHGDFGGRVLVPALAAEGIRRLDAVLMTHSDLDHCGGLVDLLDYLPVGQLLSGPAWADACGREFLNSSPTPWRPLWSGERFGLGGWRLEVLSPEPGDRGKSNDRSLVVQASWGSYRLLLAGDIEARTERRLLKTEAGELRADILKVAHHGSKTSTSVSFLQAVDPRLVLISAGRNNPYGHPSPVVLKRLRRQGRPILRTDRSGAIFLRLQIAQPMEIFLPSSPL